MGWDAHVNAGNWTEIAVASGVDRMTGYRVQANTIRSTWNVPSEYDVTDASYLAEWVHALVVQRVKETVERRRIQQEIDFSILREERRNVVGRHAEAKSTAPGLKKLFRRVS